MGRQHACIEGRLSSESSWWLKDCHGIELCRVCPTCEGEKRKRYRPEVFSGYDQGDIDEAIEPED